MAIVAVYYSILVAVHLMTSSTFFNCAWTNANVLELQSPTTKFPGGPLTNNQVGLVFSLISVGGLIGNIISLWVVEKYGRKSTLISIAFPHFVSCQEMFYISILLYFSVFLSVYSYSLKDSNDFEKNLKKKYHFLFSQRQWIQCASNISDCKFDDHFCAGRVLDLRSTNFDRFCHGI